MLAVPQEVAKIVWSFSSLGLYRIPRKLIETSLGRSLLNPLWRSGDWMGVLGDSWMECFNDLGPVYGKAGQVALSRLSAGGQKWADRFNLTRLYKDWPPLPFSEIEKILDEEVPDWRLDLQLDPEPLGVASIAQVHKAVDGDGRSWVVKIVKPVARKRLIETLDALDQLVGLLRPIAIGQVARRSLDEMSEISMSLRGEVDLALEKNNIEKMASQMRARKATVFQIPAVMEDLSSSGVLVLECFEGTPLSELVSSQASLPQDVKKKLAKRMLSELLVQVFELGLFHADPHAGNLILLENGNIGLFDWGLTGELTEMDRRHIANILKAVVALDLKALAEALVIMAEDSHEEVSIEDVEEELKRLASKVMEAKELGRKIPIVDVFEEAMKACDRLGIIVPDGLLLMAKTLVTIDGLARGIDPDIQMARVAAPVLLRAAKPGLKDFVKIGRNWVARLAK